MLLLYIREKDCAYGRNGGFFSVIFFSHAVDLFNFAVYTIAGCRHSVHEVTMASQYEKVRKMVFTLPRDEQIKLAKTIRQKAGELF